MNLVRKNLPYLLLIVLIAIAYGISETKPELKKRRHVPAPLLSVEVLPIVTQAYQVKIESFGKIMPKTQSELTSQVAGLVIAVSDKFSPGKFFNAGDLLVTIDPRDYKIKVEAADAELAQAKVTFDEEVALSKQAIKDRRNLGLTKAASAFALRKPQMAAAKAKMQAANANLKQAKLDVERTFIRAPYNGRIKVKHIGLGQVINTNTSIAQIFATDVVQVSLPIKNSELGLIELPQNNLTKAATVLTANNVIVANSLGGETQPWPATLLSTAGAIDSNSQQLHVLAQIEHPFNHPQFRSLNVGQFVNATITGKLIPSVVVIPNAAIYQGSYVYIAQQNTLQRRAVKIGHQNSNTAVITQGLVAGEILITTPLGQVSSGLAIKILGAEDNSISANITTNISTDINTNSSIKDSAND